MRDARGTTGAAESHHEQANPAPTWDKQRARRRMVEPRLETRQAVRFAWALFERTDPKSGDARLSGFSNTLVSQINSGVS